MQVNTQKIIEEDLDKDIKQNEEIISRLQSKIQTLKQLKQNPVLFEIAEKYGIPIEKVTAIVQELKQTRISDVPIMPVKSTTICSVKTPDVKHKYSTYNKGLTDAIMTVLKQYPEKRFTAAEMIQVLPKHFNPGSIHAAMSGLCIYSKVLAREKHKTAGHWAVFKYRLKRRPQRKGVKASLVAFLKDKKDFWHTSRSAEQELGLDRNTISTMVSNLAKEGLVEREVVGYVKLRHGAVSKFPTYKFKWKGK